MAQSGFTPILLYSTSTASAVPSATNLTNSTLGSELAINITDGKLFYKDNANNVQVIGWKTVPTTAGGTGLTSYTAGDLVYYASGTSLTKLGIGSSGNYLASNGSAPVWNTPGALTKVDDTNVTLTLGGNASTALLQSASLTLGWTGTLSVARGGTGTGTAFTAGSVIYAGASGVYSQNNANLFWDNTNTALGIGTTSPNTYGKLGVLSGACYFGVAQNAFVSAIFGVRPQNDGFCTMRYSWGTVGSGNTWVLDHSSGNIDWSRLVGGVSGGTLMSLGSTGNLSVTGTIKGGSTISVGNATPSTSGAGITFPATLSESTNANTLDDYEEGTWTPTWTGLTTSGSVNKNIGYYVKVGRIVYYAVFLQYTTSFTTTQGTTYHTLPFTPAYSSANLAANVSNATNIGDVGLVFSGSAVSYVPGVAAGITEVVFTATYYSA